MLFYLMFGQLNMINQQKKTGKTRIILGHIFLNLSGPYQHQIFCQWWCRRSIKYIGGTGYLLLSPTSLWVGLAVTLDCVQREMSIKVPASVLGRHLEQERPLCQYDLLSESSPEISMFWNKTSVWTSAFISVGIPAPRIQSYDRCQVCQFWFP